MNEGMGMREHIYIYIYRAWTDAGGKRERERR